MQVLGEQEEETTMSGKKTVVDLLEERIKATHVKRENLCRGLCSLSALSKYLSGKGRMDRLLLTALMQRLGLSPDNFATLLTEGEYRYFDWRQRLAVAHMERDWERAERLLEEEEEDAFCNQPLREQFRLMMQGRLQEKLSGDRNRSLGLYREAVGKTLPGFNGRLEEYMLFSAQEVSAVLLWLDLQPEKAVTEKALAFLERYLIARYSSERERVKLYPRVAARYLPFLFERGDYSECYSISERAIRMMVTSAYTSSMETVLDYQVRAAEKLGMEQMIHKKKVQLEAWCELMRELRNTQESLDDGLYLMDVWQEAALLDEVLKRSRQYRGYSQGELSEGICSPESLSRIESAKRAPNAGTFRSLAKKLSLREDYYYSDIETDDFAQLDRKWQIDVLVMNREWDKAEEKLNELEAGLDMSCGCNRQYVETKRYLLNCKDGKIPAERKFSIVREILAITVGDVPKGEDVQAWPDKFWEYPFSSQEISVMLKLADALVGQKQLEQADYLLKKLMERYQKSRVKPEFHFRTFICIIIRLSGCSGMLGRSRECLLYSEEGIRLCLSSGTRKVLPTFINNKADALENLGQKEASLKYYRLAFYSAELFERAKTAEIAKGSYEKLSGKAIRWY